MCHDDDTETTFYVKHTILGSVLRASSKEEGRVGFKEGSVFFKTVSASKAYHQSGQKRLFDRLLGLVKSREVFAKGSRYLSRGHLAPDADFVHREWQEATYFYANVAPQWQAFNNRNWKSVEGAVRNYAIFK